MQHSLIFDTEVDDSSLVLLAVAYAYGYESAEHLLAEAGSDPTDEDTAVPASASQFYPDGWTVNKMRRYTKALQPTARAVLRAIAENAPVADVDTVQAASGVDGYRFAGSMSSFGFAARNTHGVKTKPFTKVGRTYTIDPEVAKLVLELMPPEAQ